MRNLPTLHRGRLHRAVTGTAAVAFACVLTLSACSKDGGSGKDGDVASLGDKDKNAGAPPEAAAGEKGDMVKYAQCMRENGIDMPDPNADGSMMAQAIPADGGPEAAKMETASNACRKWLPNGGEITEKQKAEMRESNLKMAKCLREHGLNVPDPGPDGGMALDLGSDQAKADEAMKACGQAGGSGAMTVTK
ncbi:hypothetical protein [Yinghuangia sp. YIM S09857]|uniref:hypothetical protein n=1 Tax=Yinghuangia sp. YIM S09857 TaxID=3436929 RepID=UPI003F52DE7A